MESGWSNPSQQVRGKSRTSEWAHSRALPKNCPSSLVYVEMGSFNTSWLQREVKFLGPLETPAQCCSAQLVLNEAGTEKRRVSS